MLSGWARAQDQHDCAEFMHHLIAKICPQATAGDWSARRLEDHRLRETEEASCGQALALELPAGVQLSAQFMIHHWHLQSSVHALRRPPVILMLQLSRYSLGPEGARKNHTSVSWPRLLNVPCFDADGIESHNIAYIVEAAVLHHGQSTQSGHYTVLLHQSQGVDWLCDDGVEPRRLTPDSTLIDGPRFRSSEVYLLICRRGDTPHSL